MFFNRPQDSTETKQIHLQNKTLERVTVKENNVAMLHTISTILTRSKALKLTLNSSFFVHHSLITTKLGNKVL